MSHVAMVKKEKVPVRYGRDINTVSVGFFHVECFERMMEYSFNEGCGEQVSLFRPDLNRLAGPMEACILKEYVRRTLSRIGAQVRLSCFETRSCELGKRTLTHDKANHFQP